MDNTKLTPQQLDLHEFVKKSNKISELCRADLLQSLTPKVSELGLKFFDSKDEFIEWLVNFNEYAKISPMHLVHDDIIKLLTNMENWNFA